MKKRNTLRESDKRVPSPASIPMLYVSIRSGQLKLCSSYIYIHLYTYILYNGTWTKYRITDIHRETQLLGGYLIKYENCTKAPRWLIAKQFDSHLISNYIKRNIFTYFTGRALPVPENRDEIRSKSKAKHNIWIWGLSNVHGPPKAQGSLESTLWNCGSSESSYSIYINSMLSNLG